MWRLQIEKLRYNLWQYAERTSRRSLMRYRSMNAQRPTSVFTAFATWLLLSAMAMPAAATVISAFPVNFATPEQTTFNGAVATFEDDNPAAAPSDFTAIIDWGDGTMTAGTITSSSAAFDVLAQHTYADEGSFTVTVTIADVAPGTGTATATDTASVSEADVLSGSPMVFSAQAGVSFSGAVAAFTDSLTTNVAGDFTATINWGDATTSAGTITASGGSFTVSGTHTYAAPGTFSVQVTLTDDAPGTATAQATSTANVTPGTPVRLQDFDVR
jgi:hypothetical protein